MLEKQHGKNIGTWTNWWDWPWLNRSAKTRPRSEENHSWKVNCRQMIWSKEHILDNYIVNILQVQKCKIQNFSISYKFYSSATYHSLPDQRWAVSVPGELPWPGVVHADRWLHQRAGSAWPALPQDPGEGWVGTWPVRWGNGTYQCLTDSASQASCPWGHQETGLKEKSIVKSFIQASSCSGCGDMCLPYMIENTKYGYKRHMYWIYK